VKKASSSVSTLIPRVELTRFGGRPVGCPWLENDRSGQEFSSQVLVGDA
jgi:hypothetical protein